MLILDSSLSCSYNFEVWEAEPPCTRVKAETGDKALTSWWAVKLGRNQQLKKFEMQDIWISLTIQLNMSLLQRFFAWDFSKKFRSGTGHTHVRSLLITIFLSHRASGFAMEQKHLAWEFQPGFLSKNPCLLSQHPSRDSITLLFVKGSLVKPVSACSGNALVHVTAQLSTLWTGKKWSLSWSIYPSYIFLWWWRC